MINKNNTIIVSTTLSNNKISELRRNNLLDNFSLYNIPIIFNHGIKNKDIPGHNISFMTIKNSIELFMKTNYEYAIICDDDFFPIDNFLQEINKTIELLPTGWRTFHLCPGYLWGRRFRDISKIGKLNQEYNMTGIPFHESGRFYINCDSKIYFDNKFWLGGPVAILVNKNTVESLLNDFILEYNNYNCPNDVVLVKILNNDDFICREPMLGFEKQEGGTTF